MKAKHVFLTMGLSLVMGLGVAAGMSANREVKAAKAAGTSRLYFDVSSTTWWNNAGALTYAYCHDGATSPSWPGVPMTKVVGETYKYYVDIDSAFTKVIFCRVDPNDLTNVWNRTSKNGGISINLPSDYTIKNQWNLTADGTDYGDGNYCGNWSLYTPPTTKKVAVYVNGDKRGDEDVAIGGLPDSPEYYGVIFDGKWYTDSAMQNECTAVTASTTELYCATTTATDVTFSLDKTRATDKFADTYLYTWFDGHDPKTAWPGDKFTTSTFTVKAGSKIIINAGQDKEQTVDVTPSTVANDTLRILNSTDDKGHYNVKWASEVDSYKYSINGGTEISLKEEDDVQFASLTTVELHKGDVITFTKNGAPYAVTPKDDDQFTNVYLNGDDELVAARDCNEKFYLNVVTNKLWNGEFPSGFYLLGDNNDWNVKTGLAASKEAESDTYYVENVALAAGQGIKMTYVNSDTKNVTYYDADASKVISSTGVAYSVDDTNHNLIATNAGTYNIYYNTTSTYYSIEDTVAPTYKVSINGVATELPTHEGTEYSTAALTLTAGQEIKVLRNDVVDASFTLKQSRNNNVRSDGTVLVDATNAHIYVDTSAKTIFVEGVPLGGYHIIRNDHELITMTHGSEYEGYDQYYSDMVSFSTNDKIKFVNTNDQYDEHEARIPGLPDEFSISTINPGGNGPKFAVDGEYIKCITAIQTKVYLKLKYHADEVYFGTVEQYITDAITFGKNFCTAIEDVCEDVESAKTAEELAVARQDLEDAWEEQVIEFNDLSEEARNYLKSQAAHSVHELDDFFAKYDRVYTYRGIKFGWTLDNFLQTEYNSNAYINPIMINKANSVVMVSIIVSMVTLFASAGVVLFLFKKKKHN